MIDLYCERTGPGLFAEPVNVFSNLAFFVAAYLLTRKLDWQAGQSRLLWLLPVTLALTGLGSILFHLFASRATQLLDVLFILLFQLSGLWIYWRSVENRGRFSAWLILLAFMLTVLIASRFNDLAHGSAIYIPSLLMLLMLAAYVHVRGLQRPGLMVSALLVFLLALAFRTLDIFVCEWLMSGTHFLWHLLSAMVGWLVPNWLIISIKKGDVLPRHPG